MMYYLLKMLKKAFCFYLKLYASGMAIRRLSVNIN